MENKISRVEAYGLMSESDHEYMNQSIKELEKVIGDCSDINLQFYLNENNELFLEIASSDKKIFYRLMFTTKREQGRPSIGITKKVSLTLPEEIWTKLDQVKKETGSRSQSEVLRKILESYLE